MQDIPDIGESGNRSEWEAEHIVDEALARRLIGRQFPQVASGRLRPLGEGWDHTVWLADGRWAFRFPRRAVILPGFGRANALLGQLAPLLPLAVPAPELLGEPDAGYPWPFTGAPLIPGDEPGRAGLTDGDRAALAVPLAEFLRALHDVDPGLGAGLLELDGNRRADMDVRVPWTRERLEELAARGLWHAPAAAGELLAAAQDLPASSARAIAHGDLHGRHLLIDRGRPSGVIDWDDICLADPAIDLMPYWGLLPPAARPRFLEVYGEAGEPQLIRARVLAVFLGATLALYGRERGMTWLEADAVASLDRVFSG